VLSIPGSDGTPGGIQKIVKAVKHFVTVIAATAMAGFIGYQIYLNFFVYIDGNPTRHDLRILADAEDGDAHSQYLMGAFLTTGRQGMKPDPVEARRWFWAAADQDHPGAQYRLADLRRRGDGMNQDIAKAMVMFHVAAVGGSAAAENAIGDLYRNGEGVERDAAIALGWYGRAAGQGFASAQRTLGIMAAKGEGGPRDHAAAFQWYRKAADQGDALALNNLGVMYEHGQAVTTDPVRAWKCYFRASLASYEPARGRREALAATRSAEQLELARSTPCVGPE